MQAVRRREGHLHGPDTEEPGRYRPGLRPGAGEEDTPGQGGGGGGDLRQVRQPGQQRPGGLPPQPGLRVHGPRHHGLCHVQGGQPPGGHQTLRRQPRQVRPLHRADEVPYRHGKGTHRRRQAVPPVRSPLLLPAHQEPGQGGHRLRQQDGGGVAPDRRDDGVGGVGLRQRGLHPALWLPPQPHQRQGDDPPHQGDLPRFQHRPHRLRPQRHPRQPGEPHQADACGS